MLTKELDASSEVVATSAPATDPKGTQAAAKVHPAPSMIWMLLPIALLGLLAFLSR